jgi:hypothetical protein
MTTETTEQAEPKKTGRSTGAKWGIGCGIGCLVVILLIAAVGFAGYFVVKRLIEDTKQELVGYGFDNVVMRQMVETSDPIVEPTLFIGQAVKLLGPSSTDVAVMAQAAEIHGRIDGKLYFRGQVLTIQPNAVITGGLDVKAQAIQNYGTIEGDISGTYQAMQGNPPVARQPDVPEP